MKVYTNKKLTGVARLGLIGCVLLVVCGCGGEEVSLTEPAVHKQTVAGITVPTGLPNIQQPSDNIATLEKITLGKKLFFDKNLSIDRTVACASCHNPEQSWTNGQKYGVGVGGNEGTRNVPSLENVAYYRHLFWDGRARSLESQTLGPLLNANEMGMKSKAAVLERLEADPEYATLFGTAFEDGISIINLTRAIAAFERTILSETTPYDRYVAGDKSALSDAAKRGMRVFFRRGLCYGCHIPPSFHDHGFYNLGVGMDQEDPDLGRYHVIKLESSKGRFKTPSLRNIAKTAPYMHDGSVETLAEVVDLYNKGGIKNPTLSFEFEQRLRLTDRQKSDLVTFLVEGLTSDPN